MRNFRSEPRLLGWRAQSNVPFCVQFKLGLLSQLITLSCFNPLMPGGNKKAAHS